MNITYKIKAVYFIFYILIVPFLYISCACELTVNDAKLDSSAHQPVLLKNITKLDSKSPLKIQSVYFNYKQSDLTNNRPAVLDENIELLKKHPEISVTLQSFCDPIGNADYNNKLAFKRVTYIANALASSNVPPEKFSIKILGSSLNGQPPINLSKNEMQAIYSKDRRVDFIIDTFPARNYTSPRDTSTSLILDGDSDSGTAGDLQSIYFGYKKSNYLANQESVLKKNLDFLKNNPNVSISIEARFDPIGGISFNENLAKQRFNTLKSYFTHNGILPSRMTQRFFTLSPENKSSVLKTLNSPTSLLEFQHNFNPDRRVNFIIEKL